MKYLFVLLLPAGIIFAEEATRTIDKTFPLTGANRTVVVCGLSGSIQVASAPSNEVRFSVRERIAARTQERLDELKKEVDVVFVQESGLVKAAVKGPWSDGICGERRSSNFNRNRRRDDWDHTRVEHDFTVSVPRDARLELRNVNGGIDVTGTAGNYSVSTVNGSVKMNDVEGSGEVKSVNGTVNAVYSRNPTADTMFKTVNGKVNLYFQPGLNGDFEMKTLNGHAYTDFDMSALPSTTAARDANSGMKRVYHRTTKAALRIGGGGPKFTTETVNGDILIHSLAKGRP